MQVNRKLIRDALHNRDLLTELLREVESKAYQIAFRLVGNREDARDLTQETLWRVYSHLRTMEIRSEAEWRNWIRRITVNLFLDQARKRQPIHEAWEEQELEAPDDLEEAVMGRLLREQLLELLDELSPNQRAALVLHYYEDLPTAQVAEILGLELGNVKVLLSRGRVRLRALLTRKGGCENGL